MVGVAVLVLRAVVGVSVVEDLELVVIGAAGVTLLMSSMLIKILDIGGRLSGGS